MDDDATRWDERYRASGPSTSRPPDVVAAHPELLADLPTSGRALDVACGTGAQSLWMAERGLDVTALDVSSVAVEIARGSADTAGLSDRIELRVVDLDAGLPDDAVAMSVVLCQRFRHPTLSDGLVDALRPGGIAIVTVLSEVGTADPGPFHASPGELLATFRRPDVDVLVAEEGDGVASVVVRRR